NWSFLSNAQLDCATQVQGRRVVLNSVRLRVYDGEIMAVFGPNGSGKTTLAHIAVGFQAPSGGDVFLNQHSVRRYPQLARRRLGFLPHTCMLFPYMTVNENLYYFAKVLVLDDLTGGVDVMLRRRMLKLIKTIKGQCAVLLTSHRPDELEFVADKAANELLFSLGTRKLLNFGHTFRALNENAPAMYIRDVGFPYLSLEDVVALVAWYSVQVRRSEALSLLLLQGAVLQHITGNSEQRIEAALDFLPGGASVSPVNVFSWLSDVELKLSGATFIPISLGLFTASAALFPALDQTDGGRLLQRLAGVPGALYWVSNMLWDYGVLYLLYLLLLAPMVVIWGFGDCLEFWRSAVLLFASYGWAAIPLSYLTAQVAGSRPSRAFSLAIVIKCVFARLRRIPVAGVHPLAEQLLCMLDLVEKADRPVVEYSSGERTKLAVALALVGAPPVVLLDKPTEGLDPVARRRVWHCIITFVKKTHMSVLLATDDIEEAESVASRVLFLHRGRVRRMLNAADLDPAAERGYEITVSLDGLSGLTVTAAIEEIQETVQSLFPGRTLGVTKLKSYVRFRVMDDSVNWELLVDALDSLRRDLGLTDCRVLVTTVLQCAFYRRLVEPPSSPVPSMLMSPMSPLLGPAAAGGAGELYAGPPPRSAFPSPYAYPTTKQ
ncbi:hypothetical protein V5799_010641, partial [Amblyomma americanum]